MSQSTTGGTSQVSAAFFEGVGRLRWTLTIVALAALAACVPGIVEAWQFDRGLMQAGELWRIVTCHLTHWNFEHLQWDLLMFIVLGALCEWRSPGRMRVCIIVSALAVSSLVWIAFPNITTYRGLSGIDTALFTLLAFSLLSDGIRDHNLTLVATTGALILGFLAKTSYEAIASHAYFVDQTAAGFEVLVWDHIVAGAAGACIAFTWHDDLHLRWRTTLQATDG